MGDVAAARHGLCNLVKKMSPHSSDVVVVQMLMWVSHKLKKFEDWFPRRWKTKANSRRKRCCTL